MGGNSGGGGRSGRSGGGGGATSELQGYIDKGLLKGVQPGSRNEAKIKEMAASGKLAYNFETGNWEAGAYTAKSAKSVASKSDYKPIGERISSLQSDLARAQKGAPNYKFSKVEARLNELKAERKRLYG